jgi:hypothetical protein
MTERTQDKELDALKADIASLREEIASLAAGMKKYSGAKAAGSIDDVARAATGQEGPDHDEHGYGVFGDLWHTFDASMIQGEKVVRDLAAEVEQHPLVSIMAAFGLGYIIAKLWYRGTDNGDTRDAS